MALDTASRPQPAPGGRVLADALVAQGIDTSSPCPAKATSTCSTGSTPSATRSDLVTCRFEAGAVNMAEAYGKLTGRPAAAMVTRGPGACHGAIGVHVAMQDSTPMLLFVGQIPFEETDRDSFQEVDYRRMFGPLAKWVTQIDDARRIPELVAHAVDVATTGRPGPVVIALSEEMQKHLVDVPDLAPLPVTAPQPDPAGLHAMAELLATSRKPLAILGGSCWTDAGRAAIRTSCVAHDIPVAVGFRRQGLYDGTPRQLRRRPRRRLGPGPGRPRQGGRPGPGDRHPPGRGRDPGLHPVRPRRPGAARIVHVHPDASEIGRVFRPALGIART